VAVVAAVAVAAAAAAVAGDSRNSLSQEGGTMSTTFVTPGNSGRKLGVRGALSLRGAFPCLVTAVLLAALQAAPQAQNKAAAGAVARFGTPQQAVDALLAAADSFDLEALERLFGPDLQGIAHSGEEALDRERAARFVAFAREKQEVSIDPTAKNRAILLVGDDGWPFPIPLVRHGGMWSFDTAAGRQELLHRRIGSNELDVIEICHGYVEAQHEYALQKHDGSSVNQYAQQIISTPGRQDGLAWQRDDGTWDGPIGEAAAQAIAQGYERGDPYHGYFFKILKGQGAAAPLGEMDFVQNGAMIGGFALAAAPAEYGVTGVKTFIVSYDGIVYEKDLGPDTLEEFHGMERFNPDDTWEPVASN
jgi:hypothetical protein